MLVKSLKATFYPHRDNDYKPHAIRHYGLLVVLALLIVVQISYNYSVAGRVQVLGYATSMNQADLLAVTNQNRTASGLAGFTLNGQLNQAAQAKADHMIANDYWAHVAPDGTTPWDFIAGAGYQYLKAGENLAFGFLTSAGTVQGWMNSPGHKANILDASYENVGFGIANGIFQGGENTVVVAMYGDPVVSAAPAAPAPSAPASEAPAPQNLQAVEEPAAPAEEAAPETPSEPAAPSETVGEPELVVVGPNTQTENLDQPGSLSNLDALLSGQAHWALYFTSGILLMVGVIYLARHLAAIYTAVKRSEYYIVSHPLLEAGLVYILIWLLLSGTFGFVL